VAFLLGTASLEKDSMSKEEIIAAVKECTAKLGHAPSLAEFRVMTKISKNQIRKNFGTYTQMMAASDVERAGSGCVVEMEALFLDWAGIVRKLGKVPTMSDYELESKYSVRPLMRRFKNWSHVAAGMMDYAGQERLEGEWAGVLEVILACLRQADKRAQTSAPTRRIPARQGVLTDQPVFGQPMHAPLSCAPTNELGVVFAFGGVARELGFSILRMQSEFPDCVALRYVGNHKWQMVNIEFEHESRNFLTHMHPVSGCDLIVCWRHNWPDCPLEVVELQNVVNNGSCQD
jgi:Homing endonuclease associated repeat